MNISLKNKHISILLGGFSSEREISLISGRAVARALSDIGCQVTIIDVPNNVQSLVKLIIDSKPDIIFNALHGRFGEDGCIQGMLDIIGIPYTHSGRLASALAMNKIVAKRIFSAFGLSVAKDRILNREMLVNNDPFARPYVIKPINEGSSVGVYFVRDTMSKSEIDKICSLPDKVLMAEEYIPGREMTVAILGDRPLAVTEIITSREFYDYDAKYREGGSVHKIPAELSRKTYNNLLEISLVAHKSLGCRGLTRVDLRLDGDNPYILEVNTQPGLTPQSLVPEQASYAGISFEDLVTWIVEEAQCGD